MIIGRLHIIAIFAFTFFIGTIGDGCKQKTLVTFNTALMKTFPSTKERKSELINQLKSMDSDVVCLQEVYFEEDVRDIISGLMDSFSFSYSQLHDWNGRLGLPESTAQPCPFTTIDTFTCISVECNTSQPIADVITCALLNCNVWATFNEECISCVVSTGISNAVQQCVLTPGTKMNIPGLLLLSKQPLRDRKVVRFIPDKKQLIPRSMLVVNVERLGKLACNHLTADLGPVYYEPELQGMFSSWAEQNAFEVEYISEYFEDEDVVVMGDLNTSPELANMNITSESEGSYDLLIANGFKSPYVTLVGKGTYSDENPLTAATLFYTPGYLNSIIDHVMFKDGFKATSAKRIFDENYDSVGGPLSDHYGVEITVA